MTPSLAGTLSALALALAGYLALPDSTSAQDTPPGRRGGPPADVLAGGPGGPGGPGRGGGGFGGMQQETKLVGQFDKNNDERLDASERKAAREWLAKERAEGRGPRGFGGGRGGGPGGESEPPKPGRKLSPADVKSYPDAPLYDPAIIRTLFLEFESPDWEKELADFNNTDVEVPAKLSVDGKTYNDVGVHFRGMSSFFTVGEGRKRSLNLSMDFVHKEQNLGGYRTLNLLNSHTDPTFLRTALYYQIAREYLPAPKANHVRVVINGESWGLYINAQQFNRDAINDWFGTTKGARWKVPGSPGGRGSLAYLGDDVAEYKRFYAIKTKDDSKSWDSLIRLCKVLNDTPADQLEAALAPLLDVDGALRFLALENTFINNDGYWIRTSDYNIYQDTKGRFHILPHDANETFGRPGGPGFGGGGPGVMLAGQMLSQADKDGDKKLGKAEFDGLADAWFDKLDPEKTGKLDAEQFAAKVTELLPPPPGGGPQGGGPPGGGGGRGGFGPGRFLGPGLFVALDADKDGSLTRGEMKTTFAKWFGEWDTQKTGAVTEEKLRSGVAAVLPQQNFVGPGGRGGGPGGGGRGPGSGNMPRIEGVKLDPLLGADDPNKPLISKLLAVPALRARYLGYTRELAEKWLDWTRLGPVAEKYHALIAEDVAADTRKLYSDEGFKVGLTQDTQGTSPGPFGGGAISLKSFADQRRAYLLSYQEPKKP